jgi:hypothetical protein
MNEHTLLMSLPDFTSTFSLDLAAVMHPLQEEVEPTQRDPRSPVETASHAALPHRVVLH